MSNIAGWSRRVALVASAVVCVVVVSALTGTAAVAASGSIAPSPGQAQVQDSKSAMDDVTAALIAQKFGHAVTIDADTTETAEVSALPNGTRQLVSNTVPVRVKQAGTWVPVDASLKLVAGEVVPMATSVGVKFSSGGSGPAAQVQTPTGKWVTETWPYGDLPAPKLAGSSATYSNVLPGVDLRLTASVQGMSEVFIIKNAAASADPRVATLALQLGGATVAAEANGQSIAAAPDGSVLSSAAPTWWDSSIPGADANGPAPGEFTIPLEHRVTGKTITLDTNSVTRAASAPVYPLYVDPDWSGGLQNYWYIDRGYPTTSFSNGATARPVEKMGHASIANSSDGVEHLARDFWEMDISGVGNNHVLAAQFAVAVDYSGSCTPSEFGVYQLDPTSLAVGQTWNQSPSSAWPGSPLGTYTTNMGRSGCGAAITPIGFDVTSAAAAAAAGSSGSLVLGTRASSETDDTGYKELAQSAALTVTYNSVPTVTSPTIASPARTCGTVTGPSALAGTSPITLQATLHDADSGASVGATFNLVNGSTLAPISSFTWSPQAAGVATATVSSLSDGFYAWNVVVNDGTDNSAPSPYCYMTIVNSHPNVPGVTQTSTGTPLVGQAMTVSFTSTTSDAVAVYAFWWSDGPAGTPPPPPATAVNLGSTIPASGSGIGPVRYVRPDSGSTSATGVTVAPIDKTSTLWVASYNSAGTISQDATGYSAASLYVATGSDTTNVDYSLGHGWSPDFMTDLSGKIVADANTTTPHSLSVGFDGMDLSATSNIFGPPNSPVYSLPGKITLWQSSAYAGTGPQAPITELLPVPPGYSTAPSAIAQIFMPSTAGLPTGTTSLYRCGASGTYFASTSPTCEGVSGAAVLLGYVYLTSSSAPSNLAGSLSPLYRCIKSTTIKYLNVFDCSGGTVDTLLGYVTLPNNPAQTSASVKITQSLTVSAWVNPSSTMLTGQEYTAISQRPTAGPTNDMSLGISVSGNSEFCIFNNSSLPSGGCVRGPVLVPDQWTFLTGVWDAKNHQIRLLVGDQITPVAVLPLSSPLVPGVVPSTSGLWLGEGYLSMMPKRQWDGLIDDPSVFPGVVSGTQLDNLYNQLPPQ